MKERNNNKVEVAELDMSGLSDEELREKFNFSDEALALKNEIIDDVKNMNNLADKINSEYDDLNRMSATTQEKVKHLAEITNTTEAYYRVHKREKKEYDQHNTKTIVFQFNDEKHELTLSYLNINRIRCSLLWIGLAFIYAGAVNLAGIDASNSIFTTIMYIMLLINQIRLGIGIGEIMRENQDN
jgi:hypothetical protein